MHFFVIFIAKFSFILNIGLFSIQPYSINIVWISMKLGQKFPRWVLCLDISSFKHMIYLNDIPGGYCNSKLPLPLNWWISEILKFYKISTILTIKTPSLYQYLHFLPLGIYLQKYNLCRFEPYLIKNQYGCHI